MKSRTESRLQHMDKILSSHFVKNREDFSVADIAAYLGLNHSIARRYLESLVDGNKLQCRLNAAGHYVYNRKPPSLLRMPWRKKTNQELGIVAWQSMA